MDPRYIYKPELSFQGAEKKLEQFMLNDYLINLLQTEEQPVSLKRKRLAETVEDNVIPNKKKKDDQ